jgi:sialate O-acetylesterase
MNEAALPILQCLMAATTQAEVRLSEVFGDHMVLQRDRPLHACGHASIPPCRRTDNPSREYR